MHRKWVTVGLLLVLAIGVPLLADAAGQGGGDLAFLSEKVGDLSTTVAGPIALAGFVLACVIGGLLWACGMSVFYLFGGIILGGAIAANATTIASWLGFTG